MCIALATTAHPAYAIVIIDNRDEFILRPTSRPHWWLAQQQQILSARDLQRTEQGTWLGITKAGNFAVLTNYRETDSHDAEHPIQGTRSRGGMVTAWLTAPKNESTNDFIHRLLEGEGVKGVGGFSLLCGKLRKRTTGEGSQVEPLAIVSNRCGTADDVPWIAEARGEVYGLSNTSYTDPIPWPKVELGKEKLLQAIAEVVSENGSEDDFVQKLFDVLDTDTLPSPNGQPFEEFIFQLRKSVFIPPIGTAEPVAEMPKADAIASASPEEATRDVTETLEEAERPASITPPVMSGLYGTQRQTLLLVDWNGKVSFIERSLWDETGNAISRGEGDVKIEFQIEGWEGDDKE